MCRAAGVAGRVLAVAVCAFSSGTPALGAIPAFGVQKIDNLPVLLGSLRVDANTDALVYRLPYFNGVLPQQGEEDTPHFLSF